MQSDFLFENEKIDFTVEKGPNPTQASDDALNERYNAGAVRIVTEQARYPLPQIPQMVASSDYRLDPDFQRRHRWDNIKKSRLIESFIINVPIPPVFLYEVGYAKYEVMDGLQRLTTISDFYQSKLILAGLEEWPELNGRTYETLPEAVRRGVDRRYLSSVVLMRETASDPTEAQRLKQLVFERINSGGVSLSDQESRNAIFDGKMNRLCIKLSRTPALCRTWGIPEPDETELAGGEINEITRENDIFRRMDDVELVLRFFAYRQRLLNQDGPLKIFMDIYLQRANLFTEEVLSALEGLFRNTIDLACQLLGEEAFFLWRKRTTGWLWYRRPTTVVYDPLMFALSQFLDRSENLIAKKDEIVRAIRDLYETENSQFQGRYTNRENLRVRNDLFFKLFESILS
ncbi:MAG: DUF262 domain-containing protein [Deltaproteobacteria bacterium]|nr:DUF262 domain-containing protein [Deltaproteobacteria bacterium]